MSVYTFILGHTHTNDDDDDDSDITLIMFFWLNMKRKTACSAILFIINSK